MKIVEAFSKFAYEYNRYNVIQKEVAKRVTSYVTKTDYKSILDLGAGDGEIYRNLIKRGISVDKFVAFDFSQKMLALHPTNSSIKKICLDFNQKESFSIFQAQKFDLLISSSALQWSQNLEATLKEISKLSNEYYFSFFTSNTFKALHETANIDSPIYSKEKITLALDKFFIYDEEVIEYQLSFNSVYEMLRYIQRSGVNGGTKQLSYKDMKLLMKNYPLNYLEFEVLFVKVKKVLDS